MTKPKTQTIKTKRILQQQSLDQMRERNETRTPGHNVDEMNTNRARHFGADTLAEMAQREKDALFLDACPTDVPQLLETVKRLMEMRDIMRWLMMYWAHDGKLSEEQMVEVETLGRRYYQWMAMYDNDEEGELGEANQFEGALIKQEDWTPYEAPKPVAPPKPYTTTDQTPNVSGLLESPFDVRRHYSSITGGLTFDPNAFVPLEQARNLYIQETRANEERVRQLKRQMEEDVRERLRNTGGPDVVPSYRVGAPLQTFDEPMRFPPRRWDTDPYTPQQQKDYDDTIKFPGNMVQWDDDPLAQLYENYDAPNRLDDDELAELEDEG